MRTAIVLLLLLVSARAQASTDGAVLAQALFEQGLALMDQKDFAAACPKLRESQRLDPGGGTLLNLALCYEKQGKYATAWKTYREAEGVARRDGRADRVRLAGERGRAVEAEVPRVELEVGEQPAGARLSVDDLEIGAIAWSTPMPLDPGDHAVLVQAPGHRDVRVSFRLERAEVQRIRVPKPERKPAEAVVKSPGEAQQVVGAVGIVVGGTALLSAGSLGLMSMAFSHDPTSPSRGEDFGRAAWITAGIGAVSLVGGVVLLLTAPTRRTETASSLSGFTF